MSSTHVHLVHLAVFHHALCCDWELRDLLLVCCLFTSLPSGLFFNYLQILDVNTKATSATIYVLEDSFIKSIKAEENYVFLLNSRRKTGAKIVSK